MDSALSIFVDSDAFVALIKKDDSNHKRAEQIFNALQDRDVVFYTSNYVFAESVTVISQRIGKDIALQFIETLKAKGTLFSTIWVTKEIEKEAIKIFEKQQSKNISLVDCSNMAIIEINKFDGIFSFDKNYQTNNIHLIEERIKTKI